MNHTLRSLLSSVALVSAIALAFASPTARAADEPPPDRPPTDPTARAEWLSAQAETAFSEERYADAIRLYLDAWEAAPSATILYNVAYIYDKRLSDGELAIDYYDRAASSADADPDLQSKARARIAALRAEDARKKPPPPPPPPPGDTSFGPWVVAASGGALLIGGVVMAFVASDTQSDFEKAKTAPQKRSLQEQGRGEALVADLLMATGGVAIGVGVVWMIVESSAGGPGDARVTPMPEETGLDIRPVLLPSGGAALVIGGTL